MATTGGLFSVFTEILIEQIRDLPPDVAYDFEDETAGWELLYGDEYATYLRDGAYHVAVDVPGVTAWGYGEDVASDFYAEVDVTAVTGTQDAEAGIAFRCTDDDLCYFFLLYPDATYSLQTYVDDAWQFLIERTESDVVAAGEGATNRLGVLADGEQISLVVNDVLLVEILDDSVNGESFGLVASALGEAGVEFAFDDFRLWSLDLPTPAAETPAAAMAPTEPAATPAPVSTAPSTAEPIDVADDDADADRDSRAEVVRRVDAIRAAEPSYVNGFAPDERREVFSDAETVRYYIDETLRMRVIPEQYTDLDLPGARPCRLLRRV